MTGADGRDELDRLAELAYLELREIAHRHLARHGGERGRGTLDTVALVHEAWLKLATGTPGTWRDLHHFRAVASVAMRHILVDRAPRARGRTSRWCVRGDLARRCGDRDRRRTRTPGRHR